ncbi:hypothetical protein [Methanosphaera sp. A6]|uniref:hypothetical protein n=1 Tax=Methanosphaera sp. A6 TaxID=1860157 RepID=UPI0013018C8E|nr:hypothetical protein [Methanosphaera sp. A6]
MYEIYIIIITEGKNKNRTDIIMGHLITLSSIKLIINRKRLNNNIIAIKSSARI